MSAFLLAVNRICWNYGEEVQLTKKEKLLHAYKVLGEWQSAREQLHLEHIYNPEFGIHMGEKFQKNQHCYTLNVYKKLDEKSGEILDDILEWEGSFDKFTSETSTRLPISPASNLDKIEKELIQSAKSHHFTKKHRSIMKLLNQSELSDIAGNQDVQSFTPEYTITLQTASRDIAGIKDSQSYSPACAITIQTASSDIAGIKDSQSYSPECAITLQKYKAMTMDEFFDSHPLPTSWEDVECQSTGRKFHFLYSLNPLTVKSEAADSLSYANSFWKIPDISNQLKRFFDNWAYDRKFNSRYTLGFVDCLLELAWIQDKMLAIKNMNANAQNIFWDTIDLKDKSQLEWLFNWCKREPTIVLNIIRGTIKQLTENDESESVMFSLEELLELQFKSWLCICENEYLKLVKVTLFEKLIDHNLIYDHNLFVCQELINSGMMLINLEILKAFIDDRNSFIIEERKKLGLFKNAIPSLNEQQIISKHNEKVDTDSLYMISNITKENEEATATIPMNMPVVPPMNAMVGQHGPIQTLPQVQEYERKDKMSRKVINETTLRIYVPKNPDAEQTFLSKPTTTSPAHLKTGSTLMPGRLYSDPVHSMGETLTSLGPLHLCIACSPSTNKMISRVYLVFKLFKFVYLPDESTFSRTSTPAEGFEEYPMVPESAGTRGILNSYTCH